MNAVYTVPLISSDLGRIGPEAAADRNTYARAACAGALTEIDGAAPGELIEEFGSPLFVFSERQLRTQARHLKEVFRCRYENTHFVWSYKTNYLSAICSIFHQEGWGAEVVSDFEYQKARKFGIAGSDIIFNGPNKSRESLLTATKEGVLIQIDHWDELCLIEEIAENQSKPVKVGIRVWMDAGIQPIWSKFGFSLESGEAGRAAARIVKNKKLSLNILHTHIGTYILDPAAYGIATRKLLALREHIRVEYKHLVPNINLGGGFPSRSMLHGMTGSPDAWVPPIERYADAITDILNTLPAMQRPRLLFETGRYLVDEAGYLLTSVVAIKGVRHPVSPEGGLSSRDYKNQLLLNEETHGGYLIDAGINLLYTGAWYQINVYPEKQENTPTVPARLYGSLCMAIDVIRYQVDLPTLNLGDVLTLHPVGAYNVTQAMQFISYRPAVILINESGKPELIRRREVLEDVDGPEVLPERLRQIHD